MTLLPDLLAANDRYASRFRAGDLAAPPRRKLAVLTCMDARLDPARFLGLEEGEAHVIRNAGGRASGDALRSLIISYKLLGTRDFVVIHHTDCGMLTFANEELHDRLRRDLGVDASGLDFLPFRDLEGSVREDMAAIRSSPFIPDDIRVTGFLYDVRSGRLQPVAETAATRAGAGS